MTPSLMDGFGGSAVPAVLDAGALDELVDVIGAESVTEALGLFFESAAEAVSRIVAALERADLAEAGRQAHALKSSAALLGAAALASAMTRLEAASRQGHMAAAQEIGRGVNALLHESLAALNDARDRLG
jgi:HPt (histidine-containing phosphotransfer) domain-containing protein